MIGPDANSYIFCSEPAFGPEKIIPPRVLTPNLVRIGDRTSPPIIGGPVNERATFGRHRMSNYMIQFRKVNGQSQGGRSASDRQKKKRADQRPLTYNPRERSRLAPLPHFNISVERLR